MFFYLGMQFIKSTQCSGPCLFLFFIIFSGSLIYEKLGEKAFGWPGKCGVFISVTMQNIGGKGKKYLEKKVFYLPVLFYRAQVLSLLSLTKQNQR